MLSQVRRGLKDILAGVIFVVLGVAFATGSLAYEIGTPLRMGPAYYPLVLGGILAGLGAMVVIKGFIAGEGESIGDLDVRAVVLVTAALLFFGLTVRGLGLIGALFGASLLGALARAATSIREVVLIAAGLTALSVVIFVFALQLRLPLFGSWIPL
ncbi:MAG: tripartite tricarboxylate transporter TctB family protein [Candidatus Limnocylindria bacterium]